MSDDRRPMSKAHRAAEERCVLALAIENVEAGIEFQDAIGRDDLHTVIRAAKLLRVWKRRAAEETLAWVRADKKAQAFDRIVQSFRESIDPDDGIVNEPQDIFDLIEHLATNLEGARDE